MSGLRPDRDAAVVRAVKRADAQSAQRRYAAMSESEQRAYAAKHPNFVSRFGNVVPEHTRFAMADADSPDAADAIWDAFVRARIARETRESLLRQRMSFGERVILVIVYALASLLACAAMSVVGYVAAGRHGVLTVFTAFSVGFTLYATWRLCSGAR